MAETEDDNKPEELNPEETEALENAEEAEAEEEEEEGRARRTGKTGGQTVPNAQEWRLPGWQLSLTWRHF